MSVHSSWTWIRVPAQVCLVSCARVTPTCHGTSKLMANWLVTSGQNRTRYQPHVFVPLGAHVAVLVTGKSTQRSCYMVKRSGKLEFSLVQSRFQSRFQDVNLSMASHGWSSASAQAGKTYELIWIAHRRNHITSPNGIQIPTDDSQNTQIEDERMPFYIRKWYQWQDYKSFRKWKKIKSKETNIGDSSFSTEPWLWEG